MAPTHPFDLTTTSGVEAYIGSCYPEWQVTSFQMLSGGNTNYLYRIQLKTSTIVHGVQCDTVVLKYAADYVATDKSVALPFERQEYEVNALQYAGAIFGSDELVTPPALLHWDKEHHVILMSDAGTGSRTLKDLLINNALPSTLAEPLGTALGHFLGRLHTNGLHDEARQRFSKHAWARHIAAYITHHGVLSTLNSDVIQPKIQTTEQIDEIEAAVKEMIDVLATSNETILMGDFWSGNIIVRLSNAQGDTPITLEKIMVVDWEIVRNGVAGNDVGQFTAEMITPARIYPACSAAVDKALRAFYRTYRSSYSGFQDELVSLAAMQAGSHLIYLTPHVASWKDHKAAVRETVLEGLEYLLHGHGRDRAWLNERILGVLYADTHSVKQ